MLRRVALLFLFSGLPLLAQSVAGDWRGEICVPGSPLEVTVHLEETDGALRGTVDIPAQNAKGLELTKFSREGDRLSFAIAGVPGDPTFDGVVDEKGAMLAGTFTQGGAQLAFSLMRAETAAANEALRFDGVPAWLDETRRMFDVPGCAVAVVKRGEVVATFASGKRDVGGDLPVTADTLFAIGSSTKAFTTCVLAMLADEGKLQWDQPVRRWLPEFALADAPLGERITPRDLVTHRSGMPRHDLAWYGAQFDRADMVQRLRWLPLNHDLRTDFQYNNLMFLAAGHLAERVAGVTWEELVRQRVFTPLGMQRSNFAVEASKTDPDHATPYRRRKGETKAIPFRDITAIGPAGSINSSVREMANWVALHAQQGTFAGRTLLQPATVDDLHTVRMPLGGASDTPDLVDVGYALGWFVDVYRGHRRVHHGGNIDGFSALVALLPDAGFGFVVLTNLDSTGLPELVVRHLSDCALGLPPRDFRTAARARQTAAEGAAETAKAAATGERREGTRPSRPLAEFARDYRHSGYGDCRVTHDGAELVIDFHGLRCPLDHWHYDVFVCRETDEMPELAGAKVQFTSDLDGDVAAVHSVLDPNVPPIAFARQPDARLRDPAFLARLAGQYELSTQVATFTVSGTKLVLTLPGQRHELEPKQGLVFALAGLAGYSVRFVEAADGRVTGLVFRQPEGAYEATRRER